MFVKLSKDGLNAYHRQKEGEIVLHDRVNEAYRGDLGEVFQLKTKKRVDWIVSKVRGRKVLDVGCSQGIVPILLGNKNISVTGVDIDEKVISDAKNDLKSEKKANKFIEFVCADFLKYQPGDKYKTIIFTELLEHLYNPEEFISKAFELSDKDGTIVVTCPYGINDHPDHRQNFYLIELYEIISQYYVIDEVRFIEKWIGLVGRKRSRVAKKEFPPEELLRASEDAFYELERKSTDRAYDLEDANRALREKITRLNDLLTESKRKSIKQSVRVEELRQRVISMENSIENKVGKTLTKPLKKFKKIVKR